MKTAMTLGFAIVLAVVSMSEARIGRVAKKGVTVKLDRYYTPSTAKELQQQIKSDLDAGYHVMFELGASELGSMAKSFVTLLHGARMKMDVIDLHIHVPNSQLTEMEVPDRFFVVRAAKIEYGVFEDFLTLSITVPKVKVTLKSQLCTRRMWPDGPCTLVYTFENIAADLKTVWLRDPTLEKIVHVSTHNIQPGSIKSEVSFKDITYLETDIPKGRKEWKAVINMMHSMMSDQRIVNVFLAQIANFLV